MDELLEQFLIEGRELVQQASDDLLALEKAPTDALLIASAFRSIHTLKGSVGLFDYAPMGLVLHAAEDLLGAIRDKRLAVDRDNVDGLLTSVGQTERWIDAIANTGSLAEDAEDAARLLASDLRGLLGETPAEPRADSLPAHGDWIDQLLAGLLETPSDEPARVAVRYRPDPGAYFRGDDPIALVRTVPGLVALRIGLGDADPVPGDYDPFACNLVVDFASSAPLEDVKASCRFVADQVEIVPIRAEPGKAAPLPDSRPVDATSKTLRVDVRRIDTLAEIADELVVIKNALADLTVEAGAALDRDGLVEALAERQAVLERLVGRLHRTVMSVRLVPLTPVLSRFPRLVREIAGGLSKEVDLQIAGGEVEVDKAIADGLLDPLTHLVRNAMDHGIELPEQRRQAGKPPRATVELGVSRQGDHLFVQLRDDGRGIDPDAIRRVALERQLMGAEELAALSDASVIDLIFRPGFSTADQVTNLSGRGVGMDAVRDAVGRLGGKVSLETVLGRGTTVRLVLPLSNVLTKVVIVSCAGERYGVPMEAIVETAKIGANRIFPVRAGRAFVLRERTIPLLELAVLLGVADHLPPAPEYRVLVIRMGSELVAIRVDAYLDRRELSLRPMPRLLSGMRGIAGTALLGDGQMILVLDPGELIG
jgi:two-component system chemotaxis sensor kinase CheA